MNGLGHSWRRADEIDLWPEDSVGASALDRGQGFLSVLGAGIFLANGEAENMSKKPPTVHIEYPMFSRTMLCGKSGKGLHHTWATSPRGLSFATCRSCRALFKRAVALTEVYIKNLQARK